MHTKYSKNDCFLKLKSWLRSRFNHSGRATLRRLLTEPLGFLFQGDLPKLAALYGTDKWGSHWYAAHYARHFKHLRRKTLIILEIGIGGYEDPKAGGESLRMWRRYFPKSIIVGLDYHDKSSHVEKRIRIYQGDQSDEDVLRRIVTEVGAPDIIIDDGSHLNLHVRKTFEILFPLLSSDGIYAVEDTQTSYWPEMGGSSENLTDVPTSMCMLKELVDGLNYEEYAIREYRPTYFDQNITEMHFYHNLVFIQKGLNREGSNRTWNPS